jgi:hypothetical protein
LAEREKDPLRGSHGGLHDVVFLRQIADRLKHPLNILNERHQHAGFHGVAENLPAAVPEQEANGNRAEHFDDRKK